MSDTYPGKQCKQHKQLRTCKGDKIENCFWQPKRKVCNSPRDRSCSKESTSRACGLRTHCKWTEKSGRTAAHCRSRSGKSRSHSVSNGYQKLVGKLIAQGHSMSKAHAAIKKEYHQTASGKYVKNR